MYLADNGKGYLWLRPQTAECEFSTIPSVSVKLNAGREGHMIQASCTRADVVDYEFNYGLNNYLINQSN